MVNKVILIGRLGRDPESRQTNSGMAVAELRIATTRGRDRDGNEQTDWHTVVCFDKTAEIVSKYLSKGRQVYVEGRLQHDSWEDRETGQKRYKTTVVANTVNFLGSRNDADANFGGRSGGFSGNSSNSGRSSAPASYDNDGDIPF